MTVPVSFPAVGAFAECFKTLTSSEQALFTGICGNMHPLYVNELHAATTEFGKRLAFEFTFAALLTTALAKLCGPLQRMTDISLSFLVPVLIGETIVARAEVVSVAGQTVECRLTCRRNDEIVARGTAKLTAVVPAHAR